MIRWGDVRIDRQKRTIARGDVTIAFSPKQFQLACALILDRPNVKTALFDILYAEDEDGGPLGGIRSLDVFLCYLRRGLAPLGIELIAHGSCYYRRYSARYLTNFPERKAGDARDRRESELDGSLHGAPTHRRGALERPLLPQNRERPL